MNIKKIKLVLENLDAVILEPKDVLGLGIQGITEVMRTYRRKGTMKVSRDKHCSYLGILINKPKEIHQVSFESDNTNAYEMITAHSDIATIQFVYEDDTHESINVDFNDYNDNYNINQKNVYHNNMLEITITEENAQEF